MYIDIDIDWYWRRNEFESAGYTSAGQFFAVQLHTFLALHVQLIVFFVRLSTCNVVSFSFAVLLLTVVKVGGGDVPLVPTADK